MGLIYPLYARSPVSSSTTSNGTTTTPGPDPGSNRALVSWGYMWEEGSRDVLQESHMSQEEGPRPPEVGGQGRGRHW